MQKSGKANPRVLVTYAWVRSSWAIMRNLALCGLEVYVGDSQRFFMSRFSRYCKGWFQYPDYKENPDDFIDSVISFILDKKIGTYIPSHEEGFVVSKYLEKFPDTVKIPISPYKTIQTMDSKYETFKLLEELNIPHPKTFTFSNAQQFESLKTSLPEIGIIKHVYSHGSHGISIYESLEQLNLKWALMTNPKTQSKQKELPIIQEYINGRIYGQSFLAYEGQILANFARRNIRTKEPFGGSCVKCESIYFERGLEYAKKIALHTRYTGVAMIEFLVDEKTGDCWLMEINPRYWGTTGHDIDSGVHYPYMHYCMINNIAFHHNPEYKENFLSRWIVGDIISFFKQKNSLNKSIYNSWDYLTFDDDSFIDLKFDDPLPFLIQSYLYFKYRKQIFKSH